MEACTGAHHWARLFRQYGHTVKLMAPKFVAPYRMSGKRGKNDRLRREISPHLEHLPAFAHRCIGDLLTHAVRLEERITEYDHAIREAAKQDSRSRCLMQLPGIGPTTASTLTASLGEGHDFRNGRQLAAWVGLVPGQYSSGGKARLGRITKAGDAYLRSLLVMGARSILAGLGEKQDRFSRWAHSLVERRGYWKAAIAIAAKNLRLAKAVLHYGEDFRLNRSSQPY